MKFYIIPENIEIMHLLNILKMEIVYKILLIVL